MEATRRVSPSAEASRAFCKSSQIHRLCICARFDSSSLRLLRMLCAVFSVSTRALISSLLSTAAELHPHSMSMRLSDVHVYYAGGGLSSLSRPALPAAANDGEGRGQPCAESSGGGVSLTGWGVVFNNAVWLRRDEALGLISTRTERRLAWETRLLDSWAWG